MRRARWNAVEPRIQCVRGWARRRDPGTYRSLIFGRGLSPAGFETWIGNYYDKMLLA
jgi:hypothetical protein